ncbi:hypothetical protein NYZ58_08265 [Acinetobacter baumannii]|nr:hypothetical protein [Acinetobacter baumannii]
MKLPKPIKRGQTYRITVTYENKRYSCTRDTEKECEQWAAMKLLELKSGKVQEEKGIKTPYPFKMLCEKYYAEKGIKLRSKHVIRNKLDNLERIVGELASKSIYDFKPSDIAIVKLLYYSYKIRKKLEITHRLSRSTILYAYV